PAVSLAMAIRGELRWGDLGPYIVAQIIGGIAGVLAAHAMFDLALIQVSTTPRASTGQWIAEIIATFGLLITIIGVSARNAPAIPYAVGLYITAAYWFTASTSFSNPAVTIARTLSDTFAGIMPAHAPAFIAAQLLGMAAALAIAPLLWPRGNNS
ncbi:MAG: aquaporin, partial [Bosea sp. (in: a-proteobacteria)]